MNLETKDLEDVRLSRPVSVTDVWDLDGRIDRLQDAVMRLEKVVECLVELYLSERRKSWEMILTKMVEKQKGNCHGNRTG